MVKRIAVSIGAAALVAAALALVWAAFAGMSGRSEAAPAAIGVGDDWFCDAGYRDGVCPTTVTAGEPVTWLYPSSGASAHTVTDCGASCDSPSGSPAFGSGFLLPGQSFSHTFSQAGTVNYYCKVHPETMRGVLTVQEGNPAPTPAPTEAPAPTQAPAPTAVPTEAAEPEATAVSAPTASTPGPTALPTGRAATTPSPRRGAVSPSPADRDPPGDGASSGSGMGWPLVALVAVVVPVGLGLVGGAGLVVARRRRGGGG